MEPNITLKLTERQAQLLRDLLRQNPNVPHSRGSRNGWSRDHLNYLSDDVQRQMSEQGV